MRSAKLLPMVIAVVLATTAMTTAYAQNTTNSTMGTYFDSKTGLYYDIPLQGDYCLDFDQDGICDVDFHDGKVVVYNPNDNTNTIGGVTLEQFKAQADAEGVPPEEYCIDNNADQICDVSYKDGQLFVEKQPDEIEGAETKDGNGDENNDDDDDNNDDNSRSNCYDEGFDDGENGPFSQSQYDDCGRSYYSGFIDGCLSVEGNTRDVCESATDE